MQKAKLIGIAPQLVVKDVVKTAQYYRDIFGFTIIGYFMQPPVYAMAQRDGFQKSTFSSKNLNLEMRLSLKRLVKECMAVVNL